jgi:hypothetical protein
MFEHLGVPQTAVVQPLPNRSRRPCATAACDAHVCAQGVGRCEDNARSFRYKMGHRPKLGNLRYRASRGPLAKYT